MKQVDSDSTWISNRSKVRYYRPKQISLKGSY